MCSIIIIVVGAYLVLAQSGIWDWVGGAMLAFMALGYLTGSLNNPMTGVGRRR